MKKVMEIGQLEWSVFCNRRFLSAGIVLMLYIIGFVYLKSMFLEQLGLVLYIYTTIGTGAAIGIYFGLFYMIENQTVMKLEFEEEKKESLHKQLLKEEQEKATAQHLSKKRNIELDSQKEKLRILKDAKGVVCIIYPSKKEGVSHHHGKH